MTRDSHIRKYKQNPSQVSEIGKTSLCVNIYVSHSSNVIYFQTMTRGIKKIEWFA